MTSGDVIDALGQRDAGLFVREGTLCYAGPFLMPGNPLQRAIAANLPELRALFTCVPEGRCTADGCYRLRVSDGAPTCVWHLPEQDLTGLTLASRIRGSRIRWLTDALTVVHTLAFRSYAMLNAFQVLCRRACSILPWYQAGPASRPLKKSMVTDRPDPQRRHRPGDE
jgi:hypothetical protein